MVPFKPQMVKKNVENMMEMWHFCLFHVLIWEKRYGLLVTPHWCFRLPLFSSLPRTFKSHDSCTSCFILNVCIHHTLRILLLINNLTFPPQPSLKAFWWYSRNCFFNAQIENTHKVDGNPPIALKMASTEEYVMKNSIYKTVYPSKRRLYVTTII